MDRANSWTQLHEVDVFGNNWLGRRLRASSPKMHVLMIVWGVLGVLPLMLGLLISTMYGTLYLEGPATGLIEDYVFLSIMFYVPACISIVMVLFPRFSGILHTLKEVTLVRPSSNTDMNEGVTAKQFNDMLGECEYRVQGKGSFRYVRAAYTIFTLAWVFNMSRISWFATDILDDTWASSNYMAAFVFYTVYRLLVYALLLSWVCTKWTAIIYSMRAMCRALINESALRIRPLNPDGAGGLGSYGNYSLKMMLICVPPIIALSFMVYNGLSASLMIAIPLYFGILVFVFFYPLSGAYQAMRKSKKQELTNLSSQFNDVYDSIKLDMKNKQIAELQPRLDLMDRLDKLYSKANEMPVWPFNLATLGRFLAILGALGLALAGQWIASAIASIASNASGR